MTFYKNEWTTHKWMGEKVAFFARLAGGRTRSKRGFVCILGPASTHQIINWLWAASEKLESEKGGGMQVFSTQTSITGLEPVSFLNTHRCLYFCTKHWKPIFQSKMSTAIIIYAPPSFSPSPIPICNERSQLLWMTVHPVGDGIPSRKYSSKNTFLHVGRKKNQNTKYKPSGYDLVDVPPHCQGPWSSHFKPSKPQSSL